ncbi:MAG: tRNA (mnm(5)s(2)U34)-methyltransferase [Anaerovoracaceae bacterium]
MSNIIRSTARFSAYILKNYIKKGDVLVDATCGNGKDTLFLMESSPSKLYAFDVQETALKSTENLLISAGFENDIAYGINPDKKINLICQSHDKIPHFVKEQINAAVFNLGYLPGGNKKLTTHSDSTITAVKSCLELLVKDGILAITMYSGHLEGKTEKQKLMKFAENLNPKQYHCAYINMLNQPKNPPEILLITLK